ncbi:MAG: sodium:proton exchanger [Sphingomonadales bacterium]|jgi:cation:H+ antiporter|nr:sodium:proton exchanger [Sphingomonadales bacterium]
MFQSLPLAALIGTFVLAAIAIWLAGVKLSNSTDVLSQRFGFGEALGGVILLAIATNLPELAITASAAWSGEIGLAVGNILGGIAIQTVVLVALDAFGVPDDVPLTYRAASLTLVIEGLLVVAVLVVAIMGTQLPPTLIAARVAPDALLIAILWVVGVWLIGRANKHLPWHDTTGNAPDSQEEPKGYSKVAKTKGATDKSPSPSRPIIVFAVAATVTLVAGILLERTGESIAAHIGMSGVLFGATLLAAATALPELSTGLASTKLGDYKLAVSDIFGGNAFLPVLFLLATLISGKSVLPQAQNTDIYLAGLGILLTSVYLGGLIFRSKRRFAGMGIDSLVVLILYAIGTAGLFAITIMAKGTGRS